MLDEHLDPAVDSSLAIHSCERLPLSSIYRFKLGKEIPENTLK